MTIRDTSIRCYKEIKANGLLSKKRLEVYEAILKNAPCTSAEAFVSSDIDSKSAISQSRARFTELRELGVIYEKQVRKCRVTNKTVIEWDLTDRLPIKIKSLKMTKKDKIKKALDGLRDLYKNQKQATDLDWKLVADLIKDI